MEVILGIDPGTQIMGYSLICKSEGKPKLMLMDVLYLKKIVEMKLRIRQIYDKTQSIIDMYHPDHLAIEAPFFGKNVQSMLKLGRAQGVAIAAAMSRDLSWTEYEPATVKQTVTGKGNASKQQVANILKSLFDFDDEPAYMDATDALAIAYTCFIEQNNLLDELRKGLKPQRKQKGGRQNWADFVLQHPERKA